MKKEDDNKGSAGGNKKGSVLSAIAPLATLYGVLFFLSLFLSTTRVSQMLAED